jgi:hypothetical protein
MVLTPERLEQITIGGAAALRFRNDFGRGRR